MIVGYALQGVLSVLALLSDGGRRDTAGCHCHADLDKKLLEILENQLARCGPEKLSSCGPCVCDCPPRYRESYVELSFVGYLFVTAVVFFFIGRAYQNRGLEAFAGPGGTEYAQLEPGGPVLQQAVAARLGPTTPSRRNDASGIVGC